MLHNPAYVNNGLIKESDMPHVTVSYVMFLPGGHHRQPRNTSISLDLAGAGGGDFLPGGVCTPSFFPQLHYTLSGGSGMADLIFWSVTDGTNGQVLPPTAINQTVGALPLTITAWYFPVSGPGAPGESEIIDDAFSANQGCFIDDTFVDVTSDPSLTSNANVVGVVPTAKNQTLVAKNHVVSTAEPFYKWILNGTFMPVGNNTLQVSKGTVGIAIAVYQQSQSRIVVDPRQYAAYNPWWWIETHGGLVPPGPNPSDPWTREIASAMILSDMVSRVSPQVRVGVLVSVLRQLSIANATIEKEISSLEKQQG